MNNSDLNDLIGIQMSKTMLLMKRFIISEFQSHEAPISFDDWMNLLPLLEETKSQKDLATILGKDKTTISRLVNHWIKDGLISIAKNDFDTRLNLLQLTPRARKIHNNLRPIVQNADRVFLEKFSKSDVATMTKYLKKIQETV